MRSDVILRPATLDDAHEYYGMCPDAGFIGYVAEKDKKVIAIGGIHYVGSIPCAFSDISDEFRKDKRLIAKGIRYLMSYIDQVPDDIYAVANQQEPTSTALLKKLGWVATGLHSEHGETLVRKRK